MESNLENPEHILELTKEAQDDYVDIIHFTRDKWGETQALKYASLLEAGFKTLLSNSGVGRRKDIYFVGCHCFQVGKHIIFYRLVKQAIQIIRILHESRKFEQIFQ